MKKVILLLVLSMLIRSLPVIAQVINEGVGGNTTKDLLVRIDRDVIDLNPDLVIVMVGTNDMLNSRKMVSYSDYTSNLELLVKKMLYADCKVILMSPPPVDSVYLFTRHERSLFTQAPNVKIDSVGMIAATVAKLHNAFFFDLNAQFKDLNLPRHNEDLFINNERNSGKTDGVHPTALGYQFIAENVFLFLKENKLLKSENKIVCVGDSITMGSGVDGAGTTKGSTYPAVLSRHIHTYFSK